MAGALGVVGVFAGVGRACLYDVVMLSTIVTAFIALALLLAATLTFFGSVEEGESCSSNRGEETFLKELNCELGANDDSPNSPKFCIEESCRFSVKFCLAPLPLCFMLKSRVVWFSVIERK